MMTSPINLIIFACALAFGLRLVLAISARLSKLWTLRDVRGPPRASFLTGNLIQLSDADDGLAYLNHILAEYGSVARLNGICGDTILCISDPRALSHILLKDPDNFTGVDLTGTTQLLQYMLGPGLVTTNGSRHRKQRRMLNPLFSTAHMRRISPLVRAITQQYKKQLILETKIGASDVDIAPGLACLALEIIGQVGFGHSFNALQGGASDYIRAAKELLPATTDLVPLIIPLVASGLSNLPPRVLSTAGRILAFVLPSLRILMGCVDTLYTTAQKIWQAKKAAHATGDVLLGESVKDKGDLLSVLLQENMRAEGADRLSDEELLSQVNTFIIAGAESTSTVICRILHQLALHPETQEQLRAEIIRAGEDLEYDALGGLPVLDAVCKETLRQHTFFPFRSRLCGKATVVPLSNGGVLHIPVGTEVILNCHGVNTDPAIWGADAQAWRPERWLEPLPQTVLEARIPGVYSHSMSFFGGPKSCIGYTLAVLEMKMALAELLPAFKFALPEQDEIVWRFGITISASVKGEKSFNPTMPMRLTQLDATTF
ncbi:cytochrome P450 [Peniophora sp. CONT]|nr:cytochrome P450 [Peniophora sp. CONT]